MPAFLSKRKRFEADLLEKNEEAEQLIYIVAHDLRSPLVTIEGFAGMLGENLASKNLEAAVDNLARIKRAAGTMSRLIHDVLELSRVGRETLIAEEVNVRDVLDEAVASVAAIVEMAQARLIIGDVPETIHADRSQLVQVFMNLIGNAVKHGCPDPGGRITVGGECRTDEFVFFVQDDGPGIEPAMRDRIFKPFQRGDHRREGAGLGLAIVSKIISRHDGRTWVESTPGNGATFGIAVPIKTPAPQAPATRPAVLQ